MPIRDLEEHLKMTYSDDQRHEPVTIPDEMPTIHPPDHHMDIKPPTWSEVERMVNQERATSASGPNGIQYRHCSPEVPLEADESGMTERSHTQGVVKSRRHSDPFGITLIDCPKALHIPAKKQLC